MAEVDITPRPPEALSTLDSQETEAEEGDKPLGGDENPSNGGVQNATEEDLSEQRPDAPGESPPPARPPPEGLPQDPSTGDAKPGETTAQNLQEGQGPGEPSNVPDKEEDSEPSVKQASKGDESESKAPDGAGTPKEEHQDGRGGEERRVAGDGKETETTTGRGGEGGGEEDDKERGGVEENQAPPTPTFSTDHDDDDDVNRQQAEQALAAEEEEEAAELADQTPALLTPSGGVGGYLPSHRLRQLTTTPLEGAGLPLKPPTAQLPPVARGQVRGQQMTSAISDALKQGPPLTPKQLIRARRPPKYVRLATVTVSPARARQLPQGPSLYYEEPRRPRKVITWDEATNARPPLRIDMEGPTACSYTPRVKPLNETNAPSFTFGSKCQPEKAGGSRTAWTKSWFQTPHVWHNKVDFTREPMWPSPSHYPKGSSLGPRQRTMPEAPSFTFGHKMAYSIVKPGATKEPSPNEYKRQLADNIVLKRGPSFTHQLRREGTVLWGASEITPGPAAYSPSKPGVDRPAFTIQGIRREKSHVLGPYSSI